MQKRALRVVGESEDESDKFPDVGPTPPGVALEAAAAGLPRRLRRLRRQAPKLALGLGDLTAVVVAMCAALALRNHLRQGSASTESAMLVGALSLPVWLAAFSRHRLYSARYLARRAEEMRRVARAAALGVAGMAAISFMLRSPVSRAWLALSGILALVTIATEREVARRLFKRMRTGGSLLRPVVVVGANHEARELAAMLTNDPSLGYRLAGFVTDRPSDEVHHSISGRVLGTVAETLEVVQATGAVGVIVAASAATLDTSNRLVRDLTNAGIHVELSSVLRDVAPERLTVRPLGRFPIIYIEPVRRGWRTAAKRAFDIVLAVSAVVATALVLAVVALLIKLDSPGPVLFKQARVGRNGRIFRVLKFRTMVVDAEARMAELRDRNEADGPLFKMTHDPRVTRVGRVLRKMSIDELPQLWNVVRGEMSLVGPRPALPSEVEGWHPELHERLRVKPGMTGMWQVNGRSSASFAEYMRLDLYYVDNWSLTTDLTILAKTVPAVLASRGAS